MVSAKPLVFPFLLTFLIVSVRCRLAAIRARPFGVLVLPGPAGYLGFARTSCLPGSAIFYRRRVSSFIFPKHFVAISQYVYRCASMSTGSGDAFFLIE